MIKDCVLEGPGDNVHQNTSGIYINRVNHVKILNNIIKNYPIGIYFKHTNEATTPEETDIEVAYNYLEGNVRASLEWNGRFGKIHNNIFGPNTKEASINNDNGGAGGDYNTFSHNTFSDKGIRLGGKSGGATDVFPGAVGNKIIKNIFRSRVDVHLYSSLKHNTIFSKNIHPSSSSIVTGLNTDVFPIESSSLIGVPQFMGGANFFQAYTLQDSSLGKEIGGNDIGANTEFFQGR